ncbi:MAG TPA: adenosylcobalamin-dependent ribonucleoside-diphosphate reductase [Candidatus Binataceae bacterium]|nr:adenosylcobalamin-dependent ribonucleoside-diphosphate reductase [Candidatus Binataceae bacterium]
MRLSETAMAVLEARYLRRDESGRQIEDVSGMLNRVATAIAEPCTRFGEDPELWRERFRQRLEQLEFLPNSPTLMNAGVARGQLAACFVLPIEDNLDSIFETLGLAARIQQTGGGTGFSFSRLRPRGDVVHSTGGISSGPVSFMELFDHSTAVIRAGGRRRGANMAVLRVDHPDIFGFIDAKRRSGRLENFNLSVGVTDDFFSALRTGTPFPLRDPRSGRIQRDAGAAKLFDRLTQAAWSCGDPGLLFLDEINRRNPLPLLAPIEATNPCGEQPLLPYESCTLGSINLGKFVSGDRINWDALGETIRDAVRFLDNVIEASHYPAPRIRQATVNTRKIGLGVMGLADLLAAIGVPYNSRQGVELGGEIAQFVSRIAREVSAELGQLRGSFPAFEASLWRARGYQAMRNATVTCVAPTGTIGIIAGASGGIEPFFALATTRRILEGQKFAEVNGAVERELKRLGPVGDTAMALVRQTGALSGTAIAEELKRRFPVALEIEPEFHLLMQAAFQEHVDAAVSKTVNLPTDASPQSVREIFLRAHELHLKGVTIYRYGSRPGQTLNIVDDSETPDCRECSV